MNTTDILKPKTREDMMQGILDFVKEKYPEIDGLNTTQIKAQQTNFIYHIIQEYIVWPDGGDMTHTLSLIATLIDEVAEYTSLSSYESRRGKRRAKYWKLNRVLKTVIRTYVIKFMPKSYHALMIKNLDNLDLSLTEQQYPVRIFK